MSVSVVESKGVDKFNDIDLNILSSDQKLIFGELQMLSQEFHLMNKLLTQKVNFYFIY